MKCSICPRKCNIEEGEEGFCRGRENKKGEIICKNYGKLTCIALDPIIKKPLKKFFPQSTILSVGSYGCNLTCDFCQNSDISMDFDNVQKVFVSPKELVQKAKTFVSQGNIGIAYTYNEPLISYEYVYDTSKECHKGGLKNVVVTNGYINKSPLEKLLPYIDAFNIDLKSIKEEFYKKIGGQLSTVKSTIECAQKSSHVEITNLVIPNLNDTTEEIEEMAKYLANINEEIPLHISRFFPRYKMQNIQPTPVSKIYSLAETARKYLAYVYEGNC